jgi:hypothetical protein
VTFQRTLVLQGADQKLSAACGVGDGQGRDPMPKRSMSSCTMVLGALRGSPYTALIVVPTFTSRTFRSFRL